ncbi:MAG: hypothetical protein ACK56I_35710, partial [bacterium]
NDDRGPPYGWSPAAAVPQPLDGHDALARQADRRRPPRVAGRRGQQPRRLHDRPHDGPRHGGIPEMPGQVVGPKQIEPRRAPRRAEAHNRRLQAERRHPHPAAPRTPGPCRQAEERRTPRRH